MIEIKNVTKKYGDYVAVEDISFKVEESSIYGLVGYNGAGKTTLFNCLTDEVPPDGGTAELVDYMYEHLDEFRLLLDASYGTRFHNFVDELVRIEVEYTYKYMEAVGYAAKLDDAITEKLLHIVTTSRFEGIFEIIRHGMSRKEAAEYIELLSRYHRTGFLAIFGTVGN